MKPISPTWTRDKLAPLPREYYARPTLEVAQDLLGKYLTRVIDGEQLRGIIVEVEAYIGEDDPACHARFGLTNRNRVMYCEGGFSYVYFVYGMYNMLNVVTEKSAFPAAVLIRALEPVSGLEKMRELRGKDRVADLTNGPGKLCDALGIDTSLSGIDLTSNQLYISNGDVGEFNIASSGRIGIKEGTERQWRFFIEGNRFVSKWDSENRE